MTKPKKKQPPVGLPVKLGVKAGGLLIDGVFPPQFFGK